MPKYALALGVLALATLACGGNAPRRLELYPSPTVLPTQTERIVIQTTTPIYTYTPIVLVITSTPEPEYLCVTADEAVYLRPSPGVEYHPLSPLENGTRVMDTMTRKGEWAFVVHENMSGWVNLNYLQQCE